MTEEFIIEAADNGMTVRAEEAAKHYAEENRMYIEDQMGDIYDGIEELSDAYKAGAKWMQEEFLKGLWHPVSEIPHINKGKIYVCSIETGYRNSYNLPDMFYHTTCSTYQEMWEVEVKANCLTKWLYVNELINLII
jgi:hypothetical protein